MEDQGRLARSRQLYAESQKYIPGGVNSPVRSFRGVGGTPPFIEYGKGAYVHDVDGNRYIDFVGSWGPLILGHAHPKVVAALIETLNRGTSYGAPTEGETALARLLVEMVPSLEMVRLVNSGTEASMSAIRLARGYTGRSRVVKFAGCYHGHVDSLLVQAGSGAATLGIPDSPGVTPGTAGDTIVVAFNDLEAVKEVFAREGEQVAAVIVEPVPGNMGVVVPRPGFLQGLRQITRDYGSLLIFDEVMTGFRVARGGAQEYYSIAPDLTCLGKVIGGGLPVGAYGGSREIMEQVAPSGPVYQAGTLSGNPLAVAAGLATLEVLSEPGVFDMIVERTARLAAGLERAAVDAGLQLQHVQIGTMFCTFFAREPVVDYASARRADSRAYARFFHGMLDRGVYLAPSQFEAAFMSLAHGDHEVERTIAAAADTFAGLSDS